jgi:hypothetical protein
MRTPALNAADPKLLKTIEGLAKIQCTQNEAAAVLGVVRETFSRFLKRNAEARTLWDNGLASGKASLRRNQFKLSETNASMAIWLGKQYLGQREPAREGTSNSARRSKSSVPPRRPVQIRVGVTCSNGRRRTSGTAERPDETGPPENQEWGPSSPAAL